MLCSYQLVHIAPIYVMCRNCCTPMIFLRLLSDYCIDVSFDGEESDNETIFSQPLLQII